MKICLIEACKNDAAGSIGAFYIKYHAEQAGFKIDVLRTTKKGYDVELISLHHCTDFERLAKMPRKAKFRLVGGHPMQNNPLPCIPYADAICVGEGETWIKKALKILEEKQNIDCLSELDGTIICKDWKKGDKVPTANAENPIPYNPPYLNREDTGSAAWYIEIARGCPFRCAYCELGNSIPYRHYSKEQVKKAIDEIDSSKARKVNFFAPDEASHPNYTELYEYIKEKGCSTNYSSMRVDSVLKKDLPVNKNHLIRIGVDGLTEATRKKVNKNLTNKMILDFFRKYIDKGFIQFKIFMVFGYEWETLEDFNEFKKLMDSIFRIPLTKNINLRIKWTPFIPQPSTPLAKSKANYCLEMVQQIEMWHVLKKRPVKEPGWYVNCEPIMSSKTHNKQVLLTAGDEDIISKLNLV